MSQGKLAVNKITAEVRLKEWARMVSACRGSGMSVWAWCAEQGISEKTYYYRQRRVCSTLVELQKAEEIPAEKQSAVPVCNIQPPSENTVVITSGDIRISIADGTAPEAISALIHALKSC